MSLAPDRLEKALGALALVLLACMLIAVWKGRAQWELIPWLVWPHLATIGTALGITPVMMWRKRGDKLHRALGWVWSLCMLTTALVSFGIRMTNPGGLSLIHILSVFTLIGVPWLIYNARSHKVDAHRRGARGFVIGALLIAGFFTFPFDRLLGHWLFS